jgi:hypothetical protein
MALPLITQLEVEELPFLLNQKKKRLPLMRPREKNGE